MAQEGMTLTFDTAPIKRVLEQLAAVITPAGLSQVIAEAITAQGGAEFDNLGDGESICFVGFGPTINLVDLAEKILGAICTAGEDLPARSEAELAAIRAGVAKHAAAIAVDKGGGQ